MDHPLWPTVSAGIVAIQSGQAAEGRTQLTAAWEACGEHDHALRCIVAHYLADLQDDIRSELEWDQRALAAHEQVRDEDLAPLGIPSGASLPSLHLNLGDGWRRAGDPERASRHLEQARSALDELRDDPYGDMIRKGVEGLANRLDDGSRSPSRGPATP